MDSRTVMDLSLACRGKVLSWFFELDFRVRIRYGFRVGFAKKKITTYTHQVRSQYVGLFSVMLLYSHDRRTTEPHETESKCMIS